MLDENEIIMNALIALIPFLKEFFIGDVAIGLSNLETYTCYIPGNKMDHNVKPGDVVKEGGLASQCIKTRKNVFVEVDAKVFGFAYTGMAAPIFNSKKEIIGTLYVLESMEMKENKDQLTEIASNIITSMAKLNENMNLLSVQSENINTTSIALKQTSEESVTQVQETNIVLNLIKSIANKTNLLGINATIESTRAGKAGAGFKVVSDEIRILSANTGDSIKKIEPIIKQVHANSKNISTQVSGITDSTSSIVELINQTRSMTKMISELANEINNLAEKLVKISKRNN